MIEGFIGRPGSGKTYTMTARGIKVAHKYEAVYANFALSVPNFQPLRGPEDLLTLEADHSKVLVLIDEAHLWFPSRLSMRLPASLLMRLSQTRKAGWDLWWSAQHETRVDRVLRDVTNWLWLCRCYFAWLNWRAPDAPLIFTARCWEPENFRKPKKDVVGLLRFYRPSVAAAYDTFETLTVAGHVEAVRDFYRQKGA